MTQDIKKDKIKELVADMLNDCYDNMQKSIDRALNSGAIDIDGWDEKISPMILPKCILTAILKNESTQYDAKGTSFEKLVKKESENIRYYL